MGTPSERDFHTIQRFRDELRAAQREATVASELLHTFMRKLSECYLLSSSPTLHRYVSDVIASVDGLDRWWHDYKVREAERIKLARMNALGKLTEEEARALGVLAQWNEYHTTLDQEPYFS